MYGCFGHLKQFVSHLQPSAFRRAALLFSLF
jgi:hypothetical protein